MTAQSSPPKVSVIVPVYNAAEYLEECLDSIRNQTLLQLEIILVDDCSTDNSGEICDRYAAMDSRIKVFHLPENKGPGVARNVALDYADGEYCTFVDSDDKVHPEAYEKMFRFAFDNRLDIVRCEMGTFSSLHPEPTPIFHQYGQKRIFKNKRDLDEMAVCIFSSPVSPGRRDMNFGGSACSALHHRSLFENGGIRFPRKPHMISEDFIFCYEVLRKAKAVGLYPQMFYFYRRNLESRSNVPREDILQRALQTAEIMEQLIARDGYPQEYLDHAYLYAIEITRAFIKNFFLSNLPNKKIRKWFEDQHQYPILDRAFHCESYRHISLLHRITFEAFYKKRFYLLMALLKGRELIR